MNEDTIRDIYYVEHKWNPHFFYLSPKSFCQDLEKNGSDLYLDLFLPCIRKSLIIFVHIWKTIFPLEKNFTTMGQLSSISLLLHLLSSPLLPGVSISAVN